MGQLPKIMGILNVTPDSFSDGVRYNTLEQAVERAKFLILDGADILDIGGESTRPGADFVPADEEIRRTISLIEHLADLAIPVSIDTRKREVAKAAIAAGASIWNDVTALSYDQSSLKTAAELGCKVVLMHMQGTPKTMQENPRYDNVVQDVRHDLAGRIQVAQLAGVKSENIILDPGIGFGKTLDDNLALIRHLDVLIDLGYPVLLGTSRKSFISGIDECQADARLGGSIATALWGASRGVSYLRVHDVKETVQALKVWSEVAHG